MKQKTFRDLELEGWEYRATLYDTLLAPVTQQAIEPMLANFGDLSGKRFLDIACGTGHLAGRASQQGAKATGLDFSEAMVSQAARNYPNVTFSRGDAETLNYPDESFDAIVCAFGLMHLENPEAALSEVYRVLRHVGSYVFTVWCTPQQGNEYMALILGAIQEYGSPDVALPPAPPFFRFADEQECQKVLEAVGFAKPDISVLPLHWQGQQPQDVLELLYKSTVRLPMVLNAQPEAVRARIHQAILEGAEQYRTAEGISLNFLAKVVVATKP